MDIQTTCCVTGHRVIPVQKIREIRHLLAREIEYALRNGYTRFLFGGAEGVDLIFAELVLAFRDKVQHITLEAVIPYRNRLKNPNVTFQNVISRCDAIHVIMEKYLRTCFYARNRDMVQKSGLVIAVYDGREGGGTVNTIRYARALEREIRLISI